MLTLYSKAIQINMKCEIYVFQKRLAIIEALEYYISYQRWS